MRRGSLEVNEFVPRQIISDAMPQDCPFAFDSPSSRPGLDRTLTSCAAVLAVLALHIALIAPLWGGGGSQKRQERRFRGETALQWVVLDDSPKAAPQTPASLASPDLIAIGVSSALPALPSVNPPASSARDANLQREAHSSLGALYGRYVGQIRARIDRAWRRPRTAIGAPLFQCQVQIEQDSLGQVSDITLVQCDGAARWQLSLVRAIEAASPLPAPPDPAVFTRHVLLEFRAMAYTPHAPAGLYEPVASLSGIAAQQGSAPQAETAFQALRQAATVSHSPETLQLQIEGTKVEVQPGHR